MGLFSRRREAESAFSQSAQPPSSQDGSGELGHPSQETSDALATPAGASAMSALGGWSPDLDADDPAAALKAAQEALANSPHDSGPLSHLPMAQLIPEQIAAAMAQAQAEQRPKASED